MVKSGWRSAALVGLLTGCIASSVNAAPEEIQVYMDELNDPGEIGLDIHNNYVVSGDSGLDYSGERPSLHRYRITPEWSLGLSHSFELGAYLPLATIDHRGAFVDGLKFRLKWVAPRSNGQSWFWGANFEIGHEDHRLDQNPWSAEIKGIVGLRSGKWTAAANANFDFKVSGPAPTPATLEMQLRPITQSRPNSRSAWRTTTAPANCATSASSAEASNRPTSRRIPQLASGTSTLASATATAAIPTDGLPRRSSACP